MGEDVPKLAKLYCDPKTPRADADQCTGLARVARDHERGVAQGKVAIPPELAHDLLVLATQRHEPARSQLRLTPREQQALVLMVDGMSNKQIGRRLQISEHGAKRLVANILAKMDCNNRTLAVSRALREGLYERYARAT